MQKEKLVKENEGITLIALVITIIVMLVLVGVTISVSLKGGLFSKAKEATGETQIAQEKEQLLIAALGVLNKNGKVDLTKLDSNLPTGFQKTGTGTYKSSTGNIYQVTEDADIILLDGTEETPDEGVTVPATYKTSISGLATGVTLVAYENLATETSAAIKTAVDAGKIQAVLKEIQTVDGVSTTYTAIVPTGFEISTIDGEDSISGGLVIKDGDNEFVWVQVENAQSYTEDSFGPLEDIDSKSTYAYDSQNELDYYYGTNYYDYDDFTYETDSSNIEGSIKTYGGFYVGRYETTYDSLNNEIPQGIGVKKGKNILQANNILKIGTNSKNNEPYYYRWWGLYKVQKDMYANNSSVKSLMISSKQWDEIIAFTGYGKTKRGNDTYTTKPDLSGSAYSTDNTQYDKAKNIYDLAGNLSEWTISVSRVSRGNYYNQSAISSGASSSGMAIMVLNMSPEYCSRIVLYIY